MTRIRLDNVTKVYGSVVAVDHVSIDIEHGEFFTIIGPSGCGKTTTLRIIAGFEVPEEGKIFFDDKDVTYVKPYERNTAMVFQNYALWPHMTVFDNIAYGLRLRKVPEDEIRRRVKQVLELVDLQGLENRYPLQLSGGQQQRVALARALVVEPSVLLLDEPLSNLDAKLRLEMREELRTLQKRLGITTVYVTHDQLEALSMSDRIAVMNKGKVLQVGTPEELYMRPRTLFVAGFLGRSNLVKAKVGGYHDGYLEIFIPSMKESLLAVGDKVEGTAIAVMRPESFQIARGDETVNVIDAVVEYTMFLGDKKELRVRVGDERLVVYLPPDTRIEAGSRIKLHVRPDRIMVLPFTGDISELEDMQ
ncbi:MAG: ABC transporter ATP-binding protein [Crenarchaeota archaeon]|nr:ABC transporter ATP-binding protein [Thermoproteota archaeon]